MAYMSYVLILIAYCLLGLTAKNFFGESSEIDIDIAALENLREEAALLSFHTELWETEQEQVHKIFKKFTSLYKRSYVSDRNEYELRQQIFLESLKRHVILNQEGKNTGSKAVYGINKFSDWSQEEFKKMLGSYPLDFSMKTGPACSKIYDIKEGGDGLPEDCSYYIKDPPKSVDWRTKNVLTAVKNQGKCGSCWAFVASEQVESYWAISGKPLDNYSVQQFISCAPSLGCDGGNTCQALAWLAFAGKNKTRYRLVHASEYPYEAKETPCKYNKTSETGATVAGVCGCERMVGHEDTMLRIVAQRGPLGINVNSVLWHDYVGGIIQRHCTNLTMNHAVQIVGYNLSQPVPYWILRNSWGKDFGEDGYLRVKYGENLCGVAEEPSFVYV